MKLRISVNGETADVGVEHVEEPPVSNEIAMVITAAVAALLEGRAFRIRHIHVAAGQTLWSQLGRQQIHASHAVERKVRS